MMPDLEDLPGYLAARKPNLLYVMGGADPGGTKEGMAGAPLASIPFLRGPDGAWLLVGWCAIHVDCCCMVG